MLSQGFNQIQLSYGCYERKCLCKIRKDYYPDNMPVRIYTTLGISGHMLCGQQITKSGSVLSTASLVLPQTQPLPVLSLQEVHRLCSTLDAPQIDQVRLLCVSKLLQLRGPRVVESRETASDALVEQVAVDLQGIRAVRRLKQHPNVVYIHFNQTDISWIKKKHFQINTVNKSHIKILLNHSQIRSSEVETYLVTSSIIHLQTLQ